MVRVAQAYLMESVAQTGCAVPEDLEAAAADHIEALSLTGFAIVLLHAVSALSVLIKDTATMMDSAHTFCEYGFSMRALWNNCYRTHPMPMPHLASLFAVLKLCYATLLPY